jgi:hypothetical protein
MLILKFVIFATIFIILLNLFIFIFAVVIIIKFSNVLNLVVIIFDHSDKNFISSIIIFISN